MLIKFEVENWMSFRDKITFTTVATKERQHGPRVPYIKNYRTRILPISAIYGGNASGKTNLFQALKFCIRFIVRGTRPDELIPVEAYRLNSEYPNKPTVFKFTLLVEDSMYEFVFSVNRNSVINEQLTEITPYSSRVLYTRKINNQIEFDNSFYNEQFLQFAAKGTRENQLFLNNSVSQNIMYFKPIYDWFRNNIELIAPDTRFRPFEEFIKEDAPLYNFMNDKLQQLDTGILRLGTEEIPFDSIAMPDELKQELLSMTKEVASFRLRKDRYIVSKINGELIAKRLITFHKMSGGKEVQFDIKHESDGSKRVIELLPAFLNLLDRKTQKVFIIDELDRSLHTLLTRALIEFYLSGCNKDSRSQLLFTTHDVLLMDQNIFRRDEMWVTEREQDGNTVMFSFSDYHKDIRYDKDIRKSYLQGRLGGIPHVCLSDWRPDINDEKNKEK